MMSAEKITAIALANTLYEERVDQKTQVGILSTISKEYHKIDSNFLDENFRQYFWKHMRGLMRSTI